MIPYNYYDQRVPMTPRTPKTSSHATINNANISTTPVTPITPGVTYLLPNYLVAGQPNYFQSVYNGQMSPSQYQFTSNYQISPNYQVPQNFQVSPNIQNSNLHTPKPETKDGVTINFPIHKLSSEILVPLAIYNTLISTYGNVQMKKYATSAINPIRNYLTVYEYSINNSTVIWDYETGFVHLTGIWKAAENNNPSDLDYRSKEAKSKADIVKLLDSTPKKYQGYIKRIRGGFLKIQGTWLPYSLCKILARRFCYYIRYELIPIFGNDFPDSCLHPTDEKFGSLKFDDLNDGDIDNDKEVVEASKCLQALSNSYTHLSTSTFKLENPFTYQPRKTRTTSFDTISPITPLKKSPSGIDSLLKAADLAAVDTLPDQPPNKIRRISIRINDLLT